MSDGDFQVTASERPRSWIFQANPQIYDLAEALKRIKVFRWSVRQFGKEIRAGDRVFLWISGPSGGLVAKGITTSNPGPLEEREEERLFYTDPTSTAAELRVELQIQDVFSPPIPRASILGHPILSSISLVRAPQGTNFSISEVEADALEALGRPLPTFSELMDRYRQEGTVFQSSERAALYCITAIDEGTCEVTRLTANEPEQCPLGGFVKKLAMIRDQGGRFPFISLDGTAARRTAYLQGIELGLTPDRKDVLDLSDDTKAMENFSRLLSCLIVNRSSGPPKLYKPALMACAIEGVLAGELLENRITFDWVLPRFLDKMKGLGQEVGAQQAAYAYYSLSNELFWMLCYHDPRLFIPKSSDASPGTIKDRVRHAILKDTYWRLLTNKDHCRELLQALRSTWWESAVPGSNDGPLQAAFDNFRNDPRCRLQVKVRRIRAAQIRAMAQSPGTMTLDQFQREIWNIETNTLIDGGQVTGQLYGPVSGGLDELATWDRALDEGKFELHGNYVWRPGSRVFGPALSLTDEQKIERVRSAMQFLGDTNLSPIDCTFRD
jgi:hypothetical protein